MAKKRMTLKLKDKLLYDIEWNGFDFRITLNQWTWEKDFGAVNRYNEIEIKSVYWRTRRNVKFAPTQLHNKKVYFSQSTKNLYYARSL